MFDHDVIEPTQTPDTRKAYGRRCQQLAAAAQRKIAATTGQPLQVVDVTPTMLVDYVIGKKGDYAANSWRLVRRSVTWKLEETASRVDAATANEIMAAIARLRDEKANPDDDRKPVTSRTKAKTLTEDDETKITREVLARRAKRARDLVRYLKVGRLTGLRPCEWAKAQLLESDRPGYGWMLVVGNAKCTNGRTHGPFRTLYWVDLPPHAVRTIRYWITIAQQTDYDTRLNTIGRLLWDVTRKLWPRRKTWPTLYSTRHAAVAVWKAHYIRAGQTTAERLEALAIIAAMLGHGSDDTATQHYARAGAASRRGAMIGVPAAHPAEVARVRQVIDVDWIETMRTKKRAKTFDRS
jgi:hypothetical protein